MFMSLSSFRSTSCLLLREPIKKGSMKIKKAFTVSSNEEKYEND